MKTLILSKNEVGMLLSHELAAAAVRDAYVAFCSGRAELLPIQSLNIPENKCEIDFKSGYDLDEQIVCTKIAGGFRDNPVSYGLPTGLALICLINAQSGVPVCVMDGTLITAYRTAAAGALSASLLARPESSCVTVFGTGTQSKMQVLALSRLFNLSEVHVCGIEAVDDYIKTMQNNLPDTNFSAAKSAQEAVLMADIIITATVSTGALLDAAWVKPGTHITAVGCDAPGKQELDPALFKNAIIVNDSIEECVKRGETQHAIRQGVITKEGIRGEIGELITGVKDGRTDKKQITIFDTVGLSILDVKTAMAIYRAACDKGIGINADIV